MFKDEIKIFLKSKNTPMYGNEIYYRERDCYYKVYYYNYLGITCGIDVLKTDLYNFIRKRKLKQLHRGI